MSSTLDFLRFPPLSLWEKFRLGLGVLYASRIRDGVPLEGIPVADWLTRVFGPGNYRKMWEPLLKCKLGACREEASAAFIWATLFRLYSTRQRNASQKECLGYVRGGYRTVINRLIDEISHMGGKILTGVSGRKLEKPRGWGMNLVTTDGKMSFDRVIATIPSRPLATPSPGSRPSLSG